MQSFASLRARSAEAVLSRSRRLALACLLSLVTGGCLHGRSRPPGDALVDRLWGEAVETCFARLPRAVTEPDGRRWQVVRRAETRPHGTGEHAEEIFDARSASVFAYAIPGLEALARRDPALARLRQARALAFSMLYAFDVRAGWSESRIWRSFNKWRGGAENPREGPLPRAANLAAEGYADERGMRSPRLDLVSLATQLLLPDELEDGQLGCRLLGQARFLRERFARLEPAFAWPSRSCDAFERWARIDAIDHVEICLASPTTKAVSSLFGHLFLRVVPRTPDGAPPDNRSRVIAFVANVPGILTEDPFYPLKGVFGGYTAVLIEKPFVDSFREYVVADGRDIRRWRLNLDPRELRLLMERIYGIQHGARYSYFYFGQNCASLMIDLLDSIVPEQARLDAAGVVSKVPTSVLDGLSFAVNCRGEPLMTYIPEPFLSFEHRAAEAERRQAQIEPRLVAALAAARGADAAGQLRDALERAHAPDEPLRVGAYGALAELIRPGELDPDELRDWLRASAVVESHLSAQANIASEQLLFAELRERARELVAEAFRRAEVAFEAALSLRARPDEQRLRARFRASIRALRSGDRLERYAGYEGFADLIAELEAADLKAEEATARPTGKTHPPSRIGLSGDASDDRLERDEGLADLVADLEAVELPAEDATSRPTVAKHPGSQIGHEEAMRAEAERPRGREHLADGADAAQKGRGAMHARQPERLQELADALRLLALLKADYDRDPTRRDIPRAHRALFYPEDDLPLREQPYLAGLARMIRYPYVTRISPGLRALQACKRKLHAAFRLDALPLPVEASSASEEADRYARAWAHSGVDSMSVGAAVHPWRVEQPLALVLRAALCDEAVGDQRRHGFWGDRSLTVMRAEVEWSVADGKPFVPRSLTRVIGFRSLRRELEVRSSAWSRLGVEFASDVETAGHDRANVRTEVRLAALWPLLASRNFADHLIASAGLACDGFFALDGGRSPIWGFAAPVGLEMRSALFARRSLAHHLSAAVEVAPLIDAGSGRLYWLLAARAQARFALAERIGLWWRENVGLSLVINLRYASGLDVRAMEESDDLGFDLSLVFD